MIVLFLLLCVVDGVRGQLHYSVPEEQDHGTFVGNIAEDLGLDVTKLSSRKFQIVPSSRTPYLEVNLENGALFVNEKMDRERICKQSATCLLHLEVFLENPLELFRVEIEVLDINDNPPSFPETDITIEITESATPGTRFPVESAFDPDVGTNALRTYDITSNSYFYLDVQTQGDGNKFAELVLEKPLDREQQAVHRYVLTAVDGGLPQRTGTALLLVRVLDSNDNVPAFDQSVYTVSMPENSPLGTLVIQLNATDLDEGSNGEIVYSLSSHNSARVRELFAIDARTGRVEVIGEADYEESSTYQIYVQAKDLGPNAVPAHCKVLVKLADVNDNAPEISFSTVSESVGEQAAPGTVIALLSVTDRDSGENGQIHCELVGDAPFKLKSSFKNYYTVVTDGPLDRENVDAYTITIVAKDKGVPSLATSKSIRVQVSDENDNAPSVIIALVDSIVEGHSGDRNSSKSKETSLDLTLILIIALGSVSFVFLLAMIVLAVRCQKDKKMSIYTCVSGECCACCGACCGACRGGRQARARKKKLSKSDIMLVQSSNVTSSAQVPVEESGSFSSHHQNQNYCYQVCLTPESAKTDLMFLKPCSPSRSTDTEHNPCGAIVTGYTDQQPDIISNGSILSNETKQRAELTYLVDRPRRVNSSAFQEADIVSSKDSGHGDSEQGDSDHDATNRGHSTGADLFSNCTEECKALGHSDRCWMPSFVPSDGRQAADYRSNLHVPGMDSVPDTEVFETQEQTGDRSFSTFGKEKSHHGTLERKEFDALLPSTQDVNIENLG
ncbi:protocadherin-10-like isoform X1 [Arapaima gigas]